MSPNRITPTCLYPKVPQWLRGTLLTVPLVRIPPTCLDPQGPKGPKQRYLLTESPPVSIPRGPKGPEALNTCFSCSYHPTFLDPQGP